MNTLIPKAFREDITA